MAKATMIVRIPTLQRLQRNTENIITQGLIHAGNHVVDLASQLAPKDTEELSRSGRTDVESPKVVAISFGNGLPDERAIIQEYGSVFMPPQPYLWPAVRSIDVGLEIAKELRRVV